MSRVERDPERGRAVAAELKRLGVKKRELIRAAEQGYITELACNMPKCFCPEELGGASYFAEVTNDWSDWRSDWMPTFEHFPVYKKDGGKAAVHNAILAHRLCNRLDHSLRVGRSHGSDLARIEKAREEGIRRTTVVTGNTEGGEIPSVVAPSRRPASRSRRLSRRQRQRRRSVFLSLKFEIPAMLESGGGAIVNMASTAGLEAVGGLAGYVAAKHGVIGLTKVAALDYAAQGVRVNAIAPGPILTERLEAAGEDAQRKAGLAMPMRRIGQPIEVASAAVWLCSDHASFVTGATLVIDGGKLAGMPPFSAPG